MCHNRSSSFVREIFNTLLGPEMEFHPDAFVRRIDHRKGVAAEEMHVTKAFRDATIGHDDGDLVQRLRQQRPEIPVVVRAAKPGARIALDGVVEVREAQRIAEEKYRRIIADDVPVSLLSPAVLRESLISLLLVTRQPPSSTS